jgi:hypothetical protein
MVRCMVRIHVWGRFLCLAVHISFMYGKMYGKNTCMGTVFTGSGGLGVPDGVFIKRCIHE